MKTIFINEADAVQKWFVLDAAGKPLGRVAAKVASILRGKEKVSFAPNQEMGDCVIILNAAKVAVTGNKFHDKMYYDHSGYVGGLKARTFEKVIEKHPEEPLYRAIKGMLPHNHLGRELLKNVRIYAGGEHPHVAQNPQAIEL